MLPCMNNSNGDSPTYLAHSCQDRFRRRAMLASDGGWMVLNTPSATDRIMLLAAKGMAPPE